MGSGGALSTSYRRALERLRAGTLERLDRPDPPDAFLDASLGELAGTLLDCGERALGDRVVARLLETQRPDGSWAAAHGRSSQRETADAIRGLRIALPSRPATEAAIRRACDALGDGRSREKADVLEEIVSPASEPESLGAAREALEASHRRIADAFAGQVSDFEDHIRRGDGRFAFLLQEAGPLAEQRVLDAGCGRGALTRALLTAYPSARLVALDVSAEMLSHVPAGARAERGSIQNLPFEDAAFDLAFCVEALEHACNPEGAVDELCRVVRPGGRVLIIDKNAERAGALAIEAWERWFERREVEAWLGKHCREVRSALLVHCPELGPELFIGWRGTRR